MCPWEEISAPARKQPSSMETSRSSVTWGNTVLLSHMPPVRGLHIQTSPDPEELQWTARTARSQQGWDALAPLRGPRRVQERQQVEANAGWNNHTGLHETVVHVDCYNSF
jgi:hypothetical protein